jgi:hypothetical protein
MYQLEAITVFFCVKQDILQEHRDCCTRGVLDAVECC